MTSDGIRVLPRCCQVLVSRHIRIYMLFEATRTHLRLDRLRSRAAICLRTFIPHLLTLFDYSYRLWHYSLLFRRVVRPFILSTSRSENHVVLPHFIDLLYALANHRQCSCSIHRTYSDGQTCSCWWRRSNGFSSNLFLRGSVTTVSYEQLVGGLCCFSWECVRRRPSLLFLFSSLFQREFEPRRCATTYTDTFVVYHLTVSVRDRSLMRRV